MDKDRIQNIFKQTRQLVDGSIISTDLNSILSGLCDLINQQNEQIENLKEELSHKLSNDDLAKELENRSSKIDEFENRLMFFQKQAEAQTLGVKNDLCQFQNTFQEKYGSNFDRLLEMEKNVNSLLEDYSIIQKNNQQKIETAVNESNENKKTILDKFDKMKDLLDKYGINTIEGIHDRISSIEEKIDATQKEIHDTRSENLKACDDSKAVAAKVKKSLDDELSYLNEKIAAIQKQNEFMPEMEDIIISDEEVSLKPLLQVIMRDSRRLDSFDQQVSSVRNECENVSIAMANSSQAVQKFNHEIYDLGLEVQRSSKHFDKQVDIMKRFLRFVGRTIIDIMTDLTRITEAHSHLANATGFALDEITQVIGSITKNQTNNIPSLDEVTVEASTLNAEMSQKRMNIDISKRINTLDGKLFGSKKDIELNEIPPYEKVLKPFKVSDKVKEALGNQATETPQYYDDSFIISSLEELRVRVNEIEKTLTNVNDSVKVQFENTQDEIKKKMDAGSVDRIVTKMQSSLKRVRGEIEEMRSPSNLPVINDIKVIQNDLSGFDGSISSQMIPVKKRGISTANPLAYMSAQAKKNFREQNSEKRRNGRGHSNSSLGRRGDSILPRMVNSKLASSIVEEPRDY